METDYINCIKETAATNIAATTFEEDLTITMDKIKAMLIEKNRKYGNSALDPVRVFSTLSPDEQLNVRMDDKLSRILSAQEDDLEDAKTDLLGYLILAKVFADQTKHNTRSVTWG